MMLRTSHDICIAKTDGKKVDSSCSDTFVKVLIHPGHLKEEVVKSGQLDLRKFHLPSKRLPELCTSDLNVFKIVRA